MKVKIIILIFLSYLTAIECDVKPQPLPKQLKLCLKDRFASDPSAREEDVSTSCMLEFMWLNKDHCEVASPGTVEWLSSLVRKLASSSIRKGSTRHKRQASGGTPRRRKEYRMLSDNERREYHDAINQLKNDRSRTPNKYDALVRYHQVASRGAHGGPAFLAWHRYFLVLYELALQEKNPNVMLPYWDSTLDSAMSDPTDSVLWTREFAGNGRGNVVTGPFAGWRYNNNPLTRSVGNVGRLMDRRATNRLIRTRRSYRYFVIQLEQPHNRVHVWVGGNMVSVERSPSDPMFYMHHAFIDCVWELYRNLQKRRRRQGKSFQDPEEYPLARGFERPHHNRETEMQLPLLRNQSLTNEDGYLNFWTDEYYTYAPLPWCGNIKPDCGSKWLRCDLISKTCVSRGSIAIEPQITPARFLRVAEIVAPEPAQSAPRINLQRSVRFSHDASVSSKLSKPVATTKLTTSSEDVTKWAKSVSKESFYRILERVSLSDSSDSSRSGILNNSPSKLRPSQKRHPIKEASFEIIETKPVSVADMTMDDFYIREEQKPCAGLPTQNTFLCGCKANTESWVFIPVQVIHLRQGDIIYDSHPVNAQGNLVEDEDIFSYGKKLPFTAGLHNKYNSTENPCYQDKSGLTKVKVAAFGVNYNGMYEDHVFLDNRPSVSKAVTYIAVKRPGYTASNTFIIASDECGKVCQPMIIAKQHKHRYPTYRKFSGAAMVTLNTPEYHSDTYRGAEALVWNNKKIPYQNDNQIPIVFYCTHANGKPWF
ncbi:uncharacterized protein [Mytilus edulis]|uniref:uncharacterized protein n=1 Tax=Mytilus edulis TaxID=6550 RepID=UPI0039F0D6E1